MCRVQASLVLSINHNPENDILTLCIFFQFFFRHFQQISPERLAFVKDSELGRGWCKTEKLVFLKNYFLT